MIRIKRPGLEGLVFLLIIIMIIPYGVFAGRPDISIINISISKDFGTADSVSLIFKTDCIVNTIDKNTETLTSVPNARNRILFRLNLKNKNAVKIIQLVLYGKGWHKVFTDYVVEKGDTISLKIGGTKDNIIFNFSGWGSAKYNCRRKVEEVNEYGLQKYLEYVHEMNQVKRKLGNIPVYYKLFKSRLKSLDSAMLIYKTGISFLAFQVIQADAHSKLFDLWTREVYGFYQSAESTAEKRMIDSLFRKCGFTAENYSPDVIALTYKYADFTLRKLQTEFYFSSQRPAYDFKDVYLSIKSNFHGDLRDRMIVLLFISPSFKRPEMVEDAAGYDVSATDAYNTVKLGLAKEFLQHITNVYAKGTVAYNFSLPDSSGKLHNLEDFKGKVVLLDVWYTGCLPCAYFARHIEKEVYPFLNTSDSSLVVISISADGDRNRWIKSLKGGVYTSDYSVNLYTGGAGVNHPLMKHYNVVGFPFVLLIDRKGKIYSRMSSEMNTADIINLINTAISE